MNQKRAGRCLLALLICFATSSLAQGQANGGASATFETSDAGSQAGTQPLAAEDGGGSSVASGVSIDAGTTAEPEQEQGEAEEPDVPPYTLKGDLAQLQAKGVIRFLVPEGQDYLARKSDPRADEEQLARALADKLQIKAVFLPTPRDQLIEKLQEGAGDVIVASFAITPERSARIAFTRPIRFVQQVLVVKSTDETIHKPSDLAGKEISVRPSSSYARALDQLQQVVPTLKVKPVSERVDTVELLQQVARGEEPATVADSDIVAATSAFEPGIKVAFNLTAKDPIAWGLRKENPKLKAAIDAFLVEKAMTKHKEDAYLADLPEIKKRGVLRVLTRNASTTFFLYKGLQLGFEYELAKELAKSLGVRLEVVVPPTREALFSYLLAGRGDLIAAGVTVTPERQKQVDFSAPYLKVSELLVVPASDTATQGLADLKGKPIAVRRSSSYYQSLAAVQGQYGFTFDLVPEYVETEEVLRQLAQGKYVAAIADSNILEIELTYNSKIRAVGPIGDVREIAWAIRKDQPALKAAADTFVKKTYKGLFYNMTVNKYFKNSKQMKEAASAERSDKAGGLSPYDELVKKHAKQFEMDWRLVTSQMYQESRFDPKAKSWVGALGLMQVMPQTAKELKIDDVVDPDKGILAGVTLLSRYAKMFDGQLKEKDRIRFAMAGYNCGPGHVHDARRLAKDLGLNPDKWFGNVEQAMLLLSKPKFAKKARHGYCRCEEPVKYVSEIQSRYDTYSRLVPLH